MAEGKDLDVEDDEQAEVRRERIHSASNISGLSTGASHRHGDIALDEMDSVDEILADEDLLAEAEEKVLDERDELEKEFGDDDGDKGYSNEEETKHDGETKGSISALGSIDREEDEDMDEEIAEAKNNDVIISSLGTATVNWIKKRRSANSHAKVAMTFHNEKQLRRIFNGFDFTQDGNVDLIEFHRAVQYCKEDRSFKRMLAPPVGDGSLDNFITAFIAMDTDGDGTVDFHEFCIGMTGTAKGPFEEMSDYDINRLIEKFLEYAGLQKRNIAIESLETPSDDNNDYSKIKIFKQLFTTQCSPSKRHNHNGHDDEEMMDEEDSEMLRMRTAIEEEKSFCRKVTARIGNLKSKYGGTQKYIGSSRVKTDSFLGNFDDKKNSMSLRLRASTEGYSAIRDGISTRMITDTKGSNKSIRGKGDDRSASLKSSSISTEAGAKSRPKSMSTGKVKVGDDNTYMKSTVVKGYDRRNRK